MRIVNMKFRAIVIFITFIYVFLSSCNNIKNAKYVDITENFAKKTENLNENISNNDLQELNTLEVLRYKKVRSSFLRKKIKIAVLLPLSGRYKKIGINILDSLALALKQFHNDSLILLPVDVSDNIKNIDKTIEFIRKENIKIVIGPLFLAK